jgi:hypothetical protein
VSDLKFKVGDRVKVLLEAYRGAGLATIDLIDHDNMGMPYSVNFEDGLSRRWFMESELAPALKFKVGDRVLVDGRVMWVDSNDPNFTYMVAIDGDTKTHVWPHFRDIHATALQCASPSPWTGDTRNPFHGEDPATVAERQAAVAAEFAPAPQFRHLYEG